MGKIEEKLFDLEEYLRRNDDSADSSVYLTIIGIANDISELESENTKLRKLVSLYHYGLTHEASPSDSLVWNGKVDSLRRELGIETKQ